MSRIPAAVLAGLALTMLLTAPLAVAEDTTPGPTPAVPSPPSVLPTESGSASVLPTESGSASVLPSESGSASGPTPTGAPQPSPSSSSATPGSTVAPPGSPVTSVPPLDSPRPAMVDGLVTVTFDDGCRAVTVRASGGLDDDVLLVEVFLEGGDSLQADAVVSDGTARVDVADTDAPIDLVRWALGNDDEIVVGTELSPCSGRQPVPELAVTVGGCHEGLRALRVAVTNRGDEMASFALTLSDAADYGRSVRIAPGNTVAEEYLVRPGWVGISATDNLVQVSDQVEATGCGAITRDWVQIAETCAGFEITNIASRSVLLSADGQDPDLVLEAGESVELPGPRIALAPHDLRTRYPVGRYDQGWTLPASQRCATAAPSPEVDQTVAPIVDPGSGPDEPDTDPVTGGGLADTGGPLGAVAALGLAAALAGGVLIRRGGRYSPRH